MKRRGFLRDDGAVQEILGFMLALGAVMVLFGAAVGYGVHERDERVDAAAQAAIDDTALRIAQAINDAQLWHARHGDHNASLTLDVPLAQMPGPTGFMVEANRTLVFVNASTDARAVAPHMSDLTITSTISGNPTDILVRYDPVQRAITLELP